MSKDDIIEAIAVRMSDFDMSFDQAVEGFIFDQEDRLRTMIDDCKDDILEYYKEELKNE